MKQTSVLRMTAGICFYFSLLNIFDTFHVWRLPMALFTAVCLLLGLVIVRCSSPFARLPLSVLPVLCFLSGPFNLFLILPGLAWLCYFLVMLRGNYAMPLEDYRRNYTFMLVISLFFIAANIANSTIFSDQFISVDSLVYIFLFMILGVFAMRRMQMGAKMNLNWQLRNLLSVIGIPLLAVGASLILFLVLRFSHQALTVILIPVGRFFIWLFAKLFPTGYLPIEEMTLEEYFRPKTAAQVMEVEFGYNSEVDSTSETVVSRMLIERAAAIGGWILLGILLLLVFVLIWRRIRRERSEEKEELLYEETERIPAGRKQQRRRRMPILAGNARQLRRIYKTYLEFRKSKGINVHPSDTSAEILESDREMAESVDAVKLRDLYLAARYGNPAAVTREQVQEAQAYLERIVE